MVLSVRVKTKTLINCVVIAQLICTFGSQMQIVGFQVLRLNFVHRFCVFFFNSISESRDNQEK